MTMARYAFADDPCMRVATSSAANRVVVPCPFLVVGYRAGAALLQRQSRLGARSSAWVWLFSSTESTSALSGGSR